MFPQYRDIADYTLPQFKRLTSHVFLSTLVGTVETSEIKAFNEGLQVKVTSSVTDISAVCTQFHSAQSIHIRLYRLSVAYLGFLC
jgi:hypothetical protein